MKKLIILLFFIVACNYTQVKKSSSLNKNSIIGTWKMIYAETIENDSLKVKELSNTSFIKIINKTHFSFFNQEYNSTKNYYSGAGTYTLNKNNYTETLQYTTVAQIKNHQFSFLIELKGDTLIQSGIEKVEAAGINRKIIEKYLKIN